MLNAKIKAEYDKMLEELAELNFLQRITNNAFKREFDSIKSYSEEGRTDKVISHDAFLFNNPFNGETEKYGFKKTTVNDLKKSTIWHKNSQYCWLLMSAYEKFEIFLKNSFLILNPQGKTRDINKICCYFTNSFSSIKKSEAKSKCGIHLRVAVILIEKMRHAIAHEQCNIPCVEKFIEKVIKDSGINNNKSDHEEFISQFIVNNKVYILERNANGLSSLPAYHDVYTILVSYLIAYAYLVSHEAH